MNITEIVKNAFIFPTKNLETLSIYAILSILSGAFAIEGIVTIIFGLVDIVNIAIGAIYLLIAFVLGLNTRRISIQCIKSGIDLEEKLPDFQWWGNLSIGFKKILLTIFYFIVPAIIIVIIGLITNVPGNIINIFEIVATHIPSIITGQYASFTDLIYQSSFPLYLSLAITITIALILFLIFAFFQAMAEAKLAHTSSLKQAINIIGAIKDIKRIGLTKLVLLSILIFVIVVCIEFGLTIIFDHFIVLSILNIVITPYLALFAQRCLGLLYSDIV